VHGLAWRPDSRSVWFSAGRIGNVRAVHEADLHGRQRMVDGAPTSMTLTDISASGRTLISRDSARRGIIGTSPDDATERDLSWLDYSRPATISRDGRMVLFEEQGQGGGPGYSIYVRPTDGGPAIRLGRGASLDLSPDGRWALGNTLDEDNLLILLPTGAGEPRSLRLPGLTIVTAFFHPDGKHLVVAASEKGRGQRLYLVDPDVPGSQRAITAGETGVFAACSPDGRRIAAAPAGGAPVRIWPMEGGGEPVPLPGSQPGDTPILWGQDGRTIFVVQKQDRSARVDAIDIASGRRTLFRTLAPADESGIIGVDFVSISSDARAYAYSYRRVLSALYQVDGLR
jgi:hypothetical protein